MKSHPGNLIWVLAMILALAGLVVVLRPSPPDTAAIKATRETRQSLRAQGLKTDLADFDFLTTPEEQARAAVLTSAGQSFKGDQRENLPNLLQPVGNGSALVAWNADSVKLRPRSLNDQEPLSWGEYRARVNTNQKQIDDAAVAIMSGPIRFNLKPQPDGELLLPHLAPVANLANAFVCRAVLAMHDGNLGYAWTNLMAATRLVTAREPEPAETSHLVRFAETALAFNVLWQMMHTNSWSDARLAQLQREWEVVDFFSNLATIKAFQRAAAVAHCEQVRTDPSENGQSYVEFAETILRFPLYAWATLAERQRVVTYNQRQVFQDEQALMLYFRDRETESRDAVKATTWAGMRQLAAVTPLSPSKLDRHSRFGLYVDLYDRQGPIANEERLFARAAEAETQRRIIIIALALERFHNRHGSYPKTLAELTPEFLKAPLPDFMDGKQLRYRLGDDGHFLLYSVGLDCVDNGGKMRRYMSDPAYQRPTRPGGPLPEFDIVWPLPAGAAAMQVEQQIQFEAKKAEVKAKEAEHKHYLTEISDREWNESSARQSRVAKILAMNWSTGSQEPTFKGQSIEQFVGNANVSGTNQLSLDALLTPQTNSYRQRAQGHYL